MPDELRLNVLRPNQAWRYLDPAAAAFEERPSYLSVNIDDEIKNEP